jgi:3-methyladenine DNA glycosylase Tag
MPEMKTPDRITPQSPGDYLEVMSKVVFQSGMPYKIVKFKWPGNRKAFHEFHAAKVAGMTPTEVDRLTEDTRVIRNRRELEAVVSNAQKILELDAEFSGFQKYLRYHADFSGLVKDLRNQFKFLGRWAAATTSTWSVRKSRTTKSG